MKETSTPDSGSTWNSIYKVGAAAALVCALMYLIALGIYVPANRAGPPPATVLEWFTLFQDSPLTGLFFLGMADIAIMILWAPMSLALYVALKPSNKTWSLIAAAFVFVGIAVYLATNTAFSMLSLSQRYAVATTQTEQTILLAAGQALLALSEGTGGQYAGMPLAWFGGLLLSAVMLRSKFFSRANAWVGMLGFALLLLSMLFAGYTTAGPTTPVESVMIAVTYIGGGLLSLVWYVQVSLSLFKLGRFEEKKFPAVSRLE
jgi:hypothetical protein